MQKLEAQKVYVVGGGFAGITAAIWLKRLRETLEVVLWEREEEVLGWLSGKRGESVVMGPAGEQPPALVESGLVERAMAIWPAEQSVAWLGQLGVTLERTGATIRAAGSQLREVLLETLSASGVELRPCQMVESIRVQPDGSYRLWSPEGDLGRADRVVLATGGERNHGMALARELGLAVRPPRAGFVRLKPASLAVARSLSGLERTARVVCEKSGGEATGRVRFSERGLEGPAVSELAVSSGKQWEKLRHRLRILVDWLPEKKTGEVVRALEDSVLESSRRLVGDEPLFGLERRPWRWFVKKAGLREEDKWSRTQPRKRQRLAQLLKRQVILTEGMGLPEGERAWAGGVDTEALSWESGEARGQAGLQVAGEMLDFLLPPGGWQPAAVLATAYLAASGLSEAAGDA